MTGVSHSKNILHIGDESVELDSEIEEIVTKSRTVVVLLDPDSLDSGNTNVRAYDVQGNFVWEIEEAPVDRDEKPYMSIREEGDDVVASNWVGIEATIDLDTGELVDTSLTK